MKIIDWFKKVFVKSSFIASFRHLDSFLLMLIIFFNLCFFATVQIANVTFEKLTSNLNLEMLEAQYQTILAGTLSEMPVPETTAFLQIFNQKMIALFLYLFLFIILFIVFWSFFEGLIQTKMYGKKINKKTMLKFFVLNLCAFPLFFLLLLLFGTIIKTEFLSYVVLFFLLPLFTYFLILSYYLLFKHDVLWKSIARAFIIGTKKFYRFVIPLALIHIIMVVILVPFSLLLKTIPNMEVLLLGLPIVIVWAWARLYFKRIVDKVDDAVK